MRRLPLFTLLLSSLCPTAAIAQPAEPEAADSPIVNDAPPSSAELNARIADITNRPGGLTAREAARRARTTSPALRAKRAGLSAASSQRDASWVGFFPRLTLTGRYTRLSPIDAPSFGPSSVNLVATPAPEGPLPPGAPLVAVPSSSLSFPVLLNQYLLQTNLTVPVSDIALRAVHEHAAATHDQRAAEVEIAATERAAVANAQVAYWGWVRARMQQVVTEQTLTQASVHLDAAKALEQVARISKGDVLAAEAQVAQAELAVQHATSASSSTHERLRRLMHDDDRAHKAYEIGEDVERTTKGKPPPKLGKLYAEAQRRRPELKVVGQRAKALRRRSRASAARTAPRLDLSGNVYYANPNQRYVPQVEEWHASWDLGAQISWSPNDLPTSISSSRSLDAKAAELEAQRDDLEDAVLQEVREAYFDLERARVALDASKRVLAAVEEAYRVRSLEFRYGKATAVALADSEADLLRARLDRIDVLIGIRVARVRLDHALGRK